MLHNKMTPCPVLDSGESQSHGTLAASVVTVHQCTGGFFRLDTKATPSPTLWFCGIEAKVRMDSTCSGTLSSDTINEALVVLPLAAAWAPPPDPPTVQTGANTVHLSCEPEPEYGSMELKGPLWFEKPRLSSPEALGAALLPKQVQSLQFSHISGLRYESASQTPKPPAQSSAICGGGPVWSHLFNCRSCQGIHCQHAQSDDVWYHKTDTYHDWCE
jgi:hypothetical protein